MSIEDRIGYRSATPADLPGILAVEQSWREESRAGADKFQARLARFPQGFFVATLDEGGGQKIIATATSMPVRYDPAHLDHFTSWDAVTNNGYLFEHVDAADCNALYVVSGVIDHAYRGLNVFGPGILMIVKLAAALGMRYTLGGAVIPGYQRYRQKHGETDAYQYCITRVGKHLADPLLALYESIGFSVPDRQHVIKGYYPDDASRNYAALVVRDLQRTPL